jgi:hypothetical protein
VHDTRRIRKSAELKTPLNTKFCQPQRLSFAPLDVQYLMTGGHLKDCKESFQVSTSHGLPLRGISQQTFYRRKKTFAGMSIKELRRLKSLEDENSRLKHLSNFTVAENLTRDREARKRRTSFWTTLS